MSCFSPALNGSGPRISEKISIRNVAESQPLEDLLNLSSWRSCQAPVLDRLETSEESATENTLLR